MSDFIFQLLIDRFIQIQVDYISRLFFIKLLIIEFFKFRIEIKICQLIELQYEENSRDKQY